MRATVYKEEYYPFFKLDESLDIERAEQVEISERELKRMRRVFNAFYAVQERLRVLYEEDKKRP